MMWNIPDATIGMCNNFKDDGGLFSERTIVIAPLRVNIYPDGGKPSWGCNLWKSCQNEGCEYSRLSKERINES